MKHSEFVIVATRALKAVTAEKWQSVLLRGWKLVGAWPFDAIVPTNDMVRLWQNRNARAISTEVSSIGIAPVGGHTQAAVLRGDVTVDVACGRCPQVVKTFASHFCSRAYPDMRCEGERRWRCDCEQGAGGGRDGGRRR